MSRSIVCCLLRSLSLNRCLLLALLLSLVCCKRTIVANKLLCALTPFWGQFTWLPHVITGQHIWVVTYSRREGRWTVSRTILEWFPDLFSRTVLSMNGLFASSSDAYASHKALKHTYSEILCEYCFGLTDNFSTTLCPGRFRSVSFYTWQTHADGDSQQCTLAAWSSNLTHDVGQSRDELLAQSAPSLTRIVAFNALIGFKSWLVILTVRLQTSTSLLESAALQA